MPNAIEHSSHVKLIEMEKPDLPEILVPEPSVRRMIQNGWRITRLNKLGNSFVTEKYNNPHRINKLSRYANRLLNTSI